jgi:tRNA-guanine family transglycosylase
LRLLCLPPLHAGVLETSAERGEILGLRMLSVHNTRMFIRVMEDIRAAIAAGTFAELRRAFAIYVPTQKVLLARARRT